MAIFNYRLKISNYYLFIIQCYIGFKIMNRFIIICALVISINEIFGWEPGINSILFNSDFHLTKFILGPKLTKECQEKVNSKMEPCKRNISFSDYEMMKPSPEFIKVLCCRFEKSFECAINLVKVIKTVSCKLRMID